MLKPVVRRPKCADVRGKLAIGAATAVLALGWVTAVGPADPTCPANTGGPASACSAAARAWAARS